MSIDENFGQRWEFRRREDEIDSSSNDDKDSDTCSEPNLRKRNLIHMDEEDDQAAVGPPQLFPPMTNENQLNSRQKSQEKRPKKKHKYDPKSDKLANKKNRKSITSFKYDPVTSLQSLEKHMNSLLEEMKGTRENLLKWMKNELEKLLIPDCAFPSQSAATRKEKSSLSKRKRTTKRRLLIPDCAFPSNQDAAGIECSRTTLKPTTATMEEPLSTQATATSLIPLAAENEKATSLGTTSSVKNSNTTGLLSGLPDWPLIDCRYLILPSIHSQLQIECRPANLRSTTSVNIEPVVLGNYESDQDVNVQQPPVEHCRESMDAKHTGMSLQRSLPNLGHNASNPMRISNGGFSSTVLSGQRDEFQFKNVGQVCATLPSQENSFTGMRISGGAMGSSSCRTHGYSGADQRS